MKEYCTEKITSLCAGGQFIDTPDITGTSITREAHKTKATPKDRQCGNTKPGQFNPCPAGGQKNLLPRLALVGEELKSASGYSCSLGLLRCSDSSLRLHASSTHAEKFAPGLSSFSRSTLASTLSIMSCGNRIPLYIVLLFMWLFTMLSPGYCLNKSKDTPVSYIVKLFKQIPLTCLNTLHNLFKQFEIVRLAETAKPGSVGALTGLLTTNQPESIEVAMGNNNTQGEKILLFAACNAYVQCTAWRTSIAVFVHISAISRMRHAAHNGAVFFDGVGMASTDAITNDTPRRPIMVSLVGERSRSLANLLAGLPIPASDATSTTVKKCLRTYNGLGYVYPAPHKTGAGRCNPNMYKATPDAASVFFVVRYMCHSMAWCALFNADSAAAITHNGVYHVAHNGGMCFPYAGFISISPSTHNSTSRRQRMVTLAGQPQGWPVPLYAGIATPVNVTAPIERCNSSGDSLNLYKEAVYHG